MKIQLNARNRAYQFEADPQEKILYAGLRGRIDLPYECGSGTCGTCKATLLEGEIKDGWQDAPGRKSLKPELGEFLMCQCEALTDISAKVANFIYASDPGACLPSACTGIIRRAAQLTHDVMALTIELTEARDFDAGQFMVMSVPWIPGFRGYSMVNFERQATQLEFVIKKKPGGGLSEWLFNNSIEGTEVELYGPLGHATFFPSIAKNILCIAGGSGIAGMMSVLSRACQERYFEQFKGYVFFGVRTHKDTFYLDELSAFKSSHPEKLQVTIAFSDEEPTNELRAAYPLLGFEQGFVHEVAAREMKGKFQNTRAYVAGPPPAVDAAIRMLLLEAKLTADNIRYDKFS